MSTNQLKEKTKSVERRLEYEKNKIKDYNALQEEVDILRKRLKNCIELANESYKSDGSKVIFDELLTESEKEYFNVRNGIDDKLSKKRRKIGKLTNELDKLKRKKDTKE